MAADSFHAAVDGAMREMKNLYNIQDFVGAVDRHGTAIKMKPDEFFLFKNKLSRGTDTKYPHLSDVAEVSFKKNSTKLFWKENLTDAVYKQGEFTLKKYRNFIGTKSDVI